MEIVSTTWDSMTMAPTLRTVRCRKRESFNSCCDRLLTMHWPASMIVETGHISREIQRILAIVRPVRTWLA
jgi:hypothetical protein